MSSKSLVLPLLAAVLAVLAATLGPSFFGENPILSDDQVSIDGLPFPTSIKVTGAKQTLLGGGSRVKWGVKVYAVGIYSDPKLVKAVKKKHPGESFAGENTMASAKFVGGRRAKTLLLRFHRGVAAAQMTEALGEALERRIGKESSAKFSAFVLDVIGSDRVEAGADVFITCNGETLWASLDGGKGARKIEAMKGLCPAVFRVYIGDDPVSGPAKEAFQRGVDEFVA